MADPAGLVRRRHPAAPESNQFRAADGDISSRAVGHGSVANRSRSFDPEEVDSTQYPRYGGISRAVQGVRGRRTRGVAVTPLQTIEIHTVYITGLLELVI